MALEPEPLTTRTVLEPLAWDSIADSPLVSFPPPERLALHRGRATLEMAGTTYSGFAEFLIPASAQAIAAFYTEGPLIDQDFGGRLIIEGDSEFGPFRFDCPHCFVRPQAKTESVGRWALISPVNGPARIRYGGRGCVSKAVVLINNFDYRYGDPLESDRGWTRIGTPFATELDGRRVEFRRHASYEIVQPLATAGLLRSASVTGLSFDVLPGESDDKVLEFSSAIAGLSTIAAGGGVSVALIDLVDGAGGVVHRIVPQPVTGRYRGNDKIIDDIDLPAYFRTTFAPFVAMAQTHGPWKRLASYCGSIDDPPFMEQKFASLIMAIEFFMRNSLIEQGQTEQTVSRLEFSKLIGAVRKHLVWEIPKHYMAADTIRLWRNAVMHGGEWPSNDAIELRRLFDKWRLFLFRRVLIRLRYVGKVEAPHKGWAQSSDVADFSEGFNSFEPADPKAPNPMAELVERLREFNAGTAPSARP